VTAIRHVLEQIALGELVVTSSVVAGLGFALDLALDAYADAAARDVGQSA
jgi:hypothetical protein